MKSNNADILHQIRRGAQKGLPGQKAHIKLLPPNRSMEIPQDDDSVKKSGVLLLFYFQNEEWHLCFMERSHNLKHHPGQISFPGGRFEPEDEKTINTAIRETNEEFGLDRNKIEIVASLSPLYVSVSNFVINPYIGIYDGNPKFIINKQEVEKALTFPISKLLTNNQITNHEVLTIYGPQIVPCYLFDGVIIWGATAMILSEVFDLIDR